jgi:hypothetical protein
VKKPEMGPERIDKMGERVLESIGAVVECMKQGMGQKWE